MQTFEEILKERQEDLQEGASLTTPPVIREIFDLNEKSIHSKVTSKVSTLIEEMILNGNNSYGGITKILEQTIALVSTINTYDSEVNSPKYKKNVDQTSAMLGMAKDEYIILLNKDINRLKSSVEGQAFELNKLLDNDIKIKF